MHTTPLIIDGNSLAMRNIMSTALDDLKAGETFTGGIYGTLRTLHRLVSIPSVTVTGVYVFFDGGVPRFRKELVPEYKQKRKEQRRQWTPEQEEKIFGQVDELQTILPLLGVSVCRVSGWEADDCVAVACKVVLDEFGIRPVVVSGDRDLVQLVPDYAMFYNLSRQVLVDGDNFEERLKCSPARWLLARAIEGDSSDNIPGAPGCGPTRARKIAEYADARELEGCDIVSQIDVLRESLRPVEDAKKKTPQFIQSFLDSVDHLKKIVRAIDLTEPMRDGDLVAAVSDALAHEGGVDAKAFRKRCRDLDFTTISGDLQFTKPFERAVENRERLMEGSL